MFKNYLKIAWRNLVKDKMQTFINLLGLTIGTVSCLCIMLYVFDQMGYDQYHQDPASIFRVRSEVDGSGANGEFNSLATTSPPVAFDLKEDFPELEQVTRVVKVDIFNVDIIKVSGAENGFYESRAYLADSTLFEVFNFKLLAGDKKALNEPSTLILSSQLAKKMFGETDPVNKVVEISGYSGEPNKLTVKGVFDENYGKSHLNPNYIISMDTPGLGAYVKENNTYGGNNYVYTYAKLKKGTDPSELAAKLPSFLESRAGNQLSERGIRMKLVLQNIQDIHLYSKGIASQIEKVSDIQYLYILGILAFFIQLVACINFINLSTARANKRGKEIGIRKVAGAEKSSLVFQFLSESLLLSFFSILISIPITISLLPIINEISDSALTYPDIFQLPILISLLSLGAITGILAGIYPAMVLSSLETIKVLKKETVKGSGNGTLRRALVVFQFVLSIALISIVLIIWQQFNFTQKKNLGFQKQNLISLELNTEDARNNYESLKSQYLNISGISEITGNWFSPYENINASRELYLKGQNPENAIGTNINFISEDYIRTTGVSLLQGRDLKETDENQLLVNLATLKAMNIEKDKALGTIVLGEGNEGPVEYEIVGILDDFHFASLKNPIEPLVLIKMNNPRRMLLRLESANMGAILANMKQVWKATIEGTPFMHSFVDTEVEQMYEEEKRIGKIAVFFTILAILISALGLFGLVSYTAEQKKKEIGIRKVLGASVQSVVQLLTKDFVKLVLLALLIATPIAYLFTNRWLQDFTYRIDIHWWVFALAGAIAMLITLLTVGAQSIKSAIANPATSLRTE
ncbi:FtsX-like permease family protein [Eudoraea chungangensis]|uniref:FtsX-like permease family protein n=1 Tax=Eudoraea chungangensis TaxID=1481905 RepID=UPI0023EC9B02|nr:FtsX-like permease family protein [Eudoraea chungangensis]